jgi:hypothetical protein
MGERLAAYPLRVKPGSESLFCFAKIKVSKEKVTPVYRRFALRRGARGMKCKNSKI